jgi:hypothetical protein
VGASFEIWSFGWDLYIHDLILLIFKISKF